MHLKILLATVKRLMTKNKKGKSLKLNKNIKKLFMIYLYKNKGVLMKKILFLLSLIILLTACTKSAPNKISPEQNDNSPVLVLFSSPSNSENKIWVGTFQLAFNDFKKYIVKHDVKFQGEEETPDLEGLNKAEFNKSMLNENSYYTTYGEVKPEEKEKIKKAIKEKFNETSDILDLIDWTEKKGDYYTYAMLKKEFNFPNAFDILEPSSFNNSVEQYKFFGINKESSPVLKKNVTVLFYNNENDYAVKLITKEGDNIYLYKTKSNNSLKSLYNEMIQKQKNYNGKTFLTKQDTLKIPYLKINETKEYPFLCDKIIENTTPPLKVKKALETIRLELNEKGGKVKSEAVIVATENAIMLEEENRHFDFDETFVMFLTDSGKNDPYSALRIKNMKGMQ